MAAYCCSAYKGSVLLNIILSDGFHIPHQAKNSLKDHITVLYLTYCVVFEILSHDPQVRTPNRHSTSFTKHALFFHFCNWYSKYSLGCIY